jgi:hypothetical protein
MGIVVTLATLSYGQWPHSLHFKIPKINNDFVEAQIGFDLFFSFASLISRGNFGLGFEIF